MVDIAPFDERLGLQMNFDRQLLLDLIRSEALQRGEFTLASGKKASYYLDCRKITLHPQGANVIAAGMLQVIQAAGPLPDAVGGMAIGADPITAAIVTVAGQHNLPIKGFMVRKEPKGHGTGKQVEGPVEPGNRVVIVEDVITSGGSALKAVEAAEAFGLKVERVIGIIDRLAGGTESFRSARAGINHADNDSRFRDRAGVEHHPIKPEFQVWKRTLHQQLKRFYADDDSSTEVVMGRYRIDAVRDDELIEVQCASLAAIRDKCDTVAEASQLTRRQTGDRSNKDHQDQEAGSKTDFTAHESQTRKPVLDIFDDLIYFTRVFPNPNLVLEVPVVHVEEIRMPRRRNARRWHKDYQVHDVKLESIERTWEFADANDLLQILNWQERPGEFNTADIAAAIDRPRSDAQQIAYVLRKMGAIESVGRTKSGVIYEEKGDGGLFGPIAQRTAGAAGDEGGSLAIRFALAVATETST